MQGFMLLQVCLHAYPDFAPQSTTTHARTTGSGAGNANVGEEPDVASPHKQQRSAAFDSDQEGGSAGVQRHARRRRGKRAAGGSRLERDPLASWFQRHFAALDEQSASHAHLNC